MRLPVRVRPHLSVLPAVLLVRVTVGGGVAIAADTVLAPVTASAQSLADVARQEEERRKAIKQPSKVYSNQDLQAVPPVAASAPEAAKPGGDGKTDGKTGKADAGKASSADGAKAGDKDKKDDKDKKEESGAKDQAKGQSYWAGRKKDLQGQLDRDETFAAALQSRISALTTDFVNRDDPAQKAVIARDKQKALDELDRVQKAIQTDKKALADLEDNARRAGVPPGWLRH